MICDLSNRALLKLSGKDAKDFLSNQLSNDIANLKDGVVQLNAYCTHKGRVIVLFHVFKLKEVYYLDFPRTLSEIAIKRLKMFVLRSEVSIEDLSDIMPRFGFIDEAPDKNLGTAVYYSNRQTLLLAKAKIKVSLQNTHAWEFINFELGLPEVFLATTELFVPQMLNLDLPEVDGVSFEKGCYPGQEVVARLHYLGKAKRRMMRFKLHLADMEKSISVKPSDKLVVTGSKSIQSSGVIINAVSENNTIYLLATIEVALSDGDIYLSNLSSAKLEKLNG